MTTAETSTGTTTIRKYGAVGFLSSYIFSISSTAAEWDHSLNRPQLDNWVCRIPVSEIAMLPDIRVAIVLGLVNQAMCLRHEACAETPGRPPPPPLPRGVLSVVEHFGADPTGKADATASLQQAVVTARTHNITLFMPFGCYMYVTSPSICSLSSEHAPCSIVWLKKVMRSCLCARS